MQQSSGPEQMKLFLNKQVVRKRPASLRNFRMLMMRSAWLGLVMKAIREEGSTRWLEQPAAKPIGMPLVEQNWDTILRPNPLLFLLNKLSQHDMCWVKLKLLTNFYIWYLQIQLFILVCQSCEYSDIEEHCQTMNPCELTNTQGFTCPKLAWRYSSAGKYFFYKTDLWQTFLGLKTRAD